MESYLGIDIGAVSTKLVVIDDETRLLASTYLNTNGRPIEAIQGGFEELKGQFFFDFEPSRIAVTGSGRHIASGFLERAMVKNEITCQAIAALKYFPDVQTIIEIGGQDSKLIIIRDRMVTDFAMNTACAAGTGSFLDHQAERLALSIDEFGQLALTSRNPALVGGRCTVFAESDIIHKQQSGYCLPDIIYGLCQRLVCNFLVNLCPGKEIRHPVVFQGGVARNPGMVRAFQEELGLEVFVPEHPELTGAIGVALLAKIGAGELGYMEVKG